MDQPTATFIAGIVSAVGSTTVGLGGLVFAIRNTSKTLAYQRKEATANREHEARLRRDAERREDRLRWHRERRESYGDFAVAAGNARRGMQVKARDADAAGIDLLRLRSEAFNAFSMIQLIGARVVQGEAATVLDFIDSVIDGKPYDDKQWRKVVWGFRAAAREDLLSNLVEDPSGGDERP
ncbi:hypothetical protein [Micromonospora sp. NPDC004551]|uniref:hypothetical protein n=1 Tax=Micromonospora sp. NPDC004551 TaxID=3154284 RepID=UPI0033AD6800